MKTYKQATSIAGFNPDFNKLLRDIENEKEIKTSFGTFKVVINDKLADNEIIFDNQRLKF